MSVLYPNQYVHILNNDSGKVKIIKGPTRFELSGNEQKIGATKTATIIAEDEYGVIKNPFDEKNEKYLMGDKVIVVGPACIFLHYNSSMESHKKIHVLSLGQALRLQALQSHGNKKAGQVWQIKGPCKFIPNKYTKVLRTINTILINHGEGIYVQNTENSAKKLVKGPMSYMLEAFEDYYYKKYTAMEKKALKLPYSEDYQAKPIHLKKGQVVCILDAEKNERYIPGPGSYILQPEEHVKILELAAGKPKKPYQIKAAIINLGPDFMSDKFEVRTKDNAHLSLLITYKWEFVVDEKQVNKVFSMPDFIGYSCTTLCSLIREEVSKYNFEEFHKNSVGLIRGAVFKKHVIKNSKGGTVEKFGYFFDEIYFLITEVDVKAVQPVNREINKLLNQSIKNNMRIVCNKMEQEARLLAQKEKIKSDQDLAGLKSELISTENSNLSLERVEKARISGKVKILEANYEKECEELRLKAKADTEIERMKRIIGLLSTPEGERYMELMKQQNLGKINQQWYVSSDSKVDLPFKK